MRLNKRSKETHFHCGSRVSSGEVYSAKKITGAPAMEHAKYFRVNAAYVPLADIGNVCWSECPSKVIHFV
jgi:hypothetical protein